MVNTLINLLKDETVATAIKYGLIAAPIAVFAVIVLGTINTDLINVFTTVSNIRQYGTKTIPDDYQNPVIACAAILLAMVIFQQLSSAVRQRS
jgi:Flp pilus assembly pilin Flp